MRASLVVNCQSAVMAADLPPEQWTPGLCGFPVCLLRGDIAESGVDPPTIVIAFDISEQVAPRGMPIGIVALMGQFGFQGAQEALHRRIVPAVPFAAHCLPDGCGLRHLAV